MIGIFVGYASDMTGAGAEHDAILQPQAIAQDDSDPALAMQLVEGEDTVLFTAIINKEQYQRLVGAGAEEI